MHHLSEKLDHELQIDAVAKVKKCVSFKQTKPKLKAEFPGPTGGSQHPPLPLRPPPNLQLNFKHLLCVQRSFFQMVISFLFFWKTFSYMLVLGNIKTNVLIASSKYPVKYLKLFFAPVNVELTVLSTLTSQILIVFFAPKNSPFATFVLPNLNIILSKYCVIKIFHIVSAPIFFVLSYVLHNGSK